MISKLDVDSENRQISREAVEWLLRRIIQLPRNWLIISIIFILLSTLEITWGKEPSFKFQVTTTTAIFLALIWLPAILKIFALTGGALKTPAGEITGSSIMPMLRSLTSDSLGFLIEQSKVAEDIAPPQQQQEMRQIRHEWQKVYASRVPLSEAHQQMELLAQRYKELRNSMSPSPQRTFEMESIAGRMRALASQSKFSTKEVNNLLQSRDQGKRLLGLSIADWSGDPIFFDSILHIISHSETAFEQYIALRSMRKIVSKLDTQQQKNLKAVLIDQRNFNPDEKRWIRPDSNRWLLSERLLSALEE